MEIPDKDVKGKLQDMVIVFSSIERAYDFEPHIAEISEPAPKSTDQAYNNKVGRDQDKSPKK